MRRDTRRTAAGKKKEKPETAVPHSIFAFGYPADGEMSKRRDLYEANWVHFEKW